MSVEKLVKTGIKKEPGYLYFVDKDGDVSRAPMTRGKSRKSAVKEKVFKAGIRRVPGFLYFVDKDGDICRAEVRKH